MKRRSTSRVDVRSNPSAIALVAGLAVVATLQLACSSSRVAPNPTQVRAEAIRQARAASNISAGVRLICPTLGASRAQLPPQVPGTHRVILSWKASVPPDSSHAAAEGYCVYRGNKPQDPFPTLVNSMPFPGTTCTDDLVENDKKYYYVVRAISAKGVTSITSNEVPVAILNGKLPNPSVARTPSPPLCRVPPSVQ
jgi:fibronectin type 3 domain-containing protein